MRALLGKRADEVVWKHAQEKNKDPTLYKEQDPEDLIANEEEIPNAIWDEFGSEIAPSVRG